MSLKRILIVVGIALVVALFFVFDLSQYFEFERLQAWVEQEPVLAAAAYVVVYMLVASLSLPGVGPLSIAGGAVFGLWWGAVLVSFASSIGATIAFLISRTLLRDWVERHFQKALNKVNEGVDRDGALFLATLRLIPPIPFFIINLTFGLTHLSAKTFYIVSQVAMLPATFLFVNAGASIGRVEEFSFFELFTPEIVLSFAALLMFPIAIKWVMKKTGLTKNQEKFDTVESE